jgi:hypothetical protein
MGSIVIISHIFSEPLLGASIISPGLYLMFTLSPFATSTWKASREMG